MLPAFLSGTPILATGVNSLQCKGSTLQNSLKFKLMHYPAALLFDRKVAG
jgi:hypothetical protein